ncbi:cytokine SCM-1 beta [Mus pahari]|uniref:Lymphotactin n=1 Tax=Mus pahari TaxID=10093 RepID=A0A4D6YVR9_MUSPA|nr:cytokine SCM-1 beta [Mus pahari]QCI30380.1 chemokine XCL1 [Mus pahari]
MRLPLLTFLGVCCLITCVVEGVGTEVLERSICVSLQTRRLPVQKIKTYTIKEGTMRAVIFVTKRGLKICADPEANWVKAAIKTVDGRASTRKNTAETVPTGAQRSTSTAITLTG